MKRAFLLLALLLPIQAFADPYCTNGTSQLTSAGVTGATIICRVQFDTTNVSGEAYDHYVDIIYPTAIGVGNSTAPIIVMGTGVGFGAVNMVPSYRLFEYSPVFTQQLISAGFVLYLPYTTLSATGSLTSAASSSATSISIQPYIGTASYYPNGSVCNTNGATYPAAPTFPALCAYSYPYTVIIDEGTANQEVVSVTADNGTSSYPLTLTVSALAHNHSIGAIVDVPKTQWPAPLCTRMSFLSWLNATAGKGSYPGNPGDVRYWAASSDSQIAMMSLYTTGYLSSRPANSSWWDSINSGYGPTCTSNNSGPVPAFRASVFVSDPLELTWMTTPADNFQGVPNVRTLLGCTPGVDSGCNTFASAWASPANIATGTVPTLLQVGTLDYMTPICISGGGCPAAGNEYATWQSNYNSKGLNYQVWTGEDHGCNSINNAFGVPEAQPAQFEMLMQHMGSKPSGMTSAAGGLW
jgi:hypothetical protein